MPASGTPWSPTFDFAGDPSPQQLINAAALQAQLVSLAAFLAQQNISLERVIRPDDTLTDALVRIRNLHPELSEWLSSLINGQVAAQALSWLYPARVTSGTNVASLAALPVIDGVQLVDGDRVLLRGQSNPIENGLWVATDQGSTLWTRPTDYPAGMDLAQPYAVIVREGTLGAETAWAVVTGESVPGGATAPIVDTDSVTFFPVWGPFPLPISKGGTGATTAAGARTALGCPGKQSFNLTGTGAQSVWTITHTLNTTDLVWSLKDAASSSIAGVDLTVVDNSTVQVVFTTAPIAALVHRLVLIG